MSLYASLSPEGRTLVDAAVEHLLGGYDPATGLVTEVLEGHPYRSVRNSMYLALGLLIREDSDCDTVSDRICRAVLDLQIDAPGEIYHGVFRHPDESVPPKGLFPVEQVSPMTRYMADVTWEHITSAFDRELLESGDPALAGRAGDIAAALRRALLHTVPVAWATYEPNLREFIGMTFSMLLEHFDAHLSSDLRARILRACRLLVQGAMDRVRRDLTPLNTNIRIMYVFLLDDLGRRLGEPAWQAEALREGRALAEDYRLDHACAEFNSPTYCGVDLSTLGFIRKYSRCAELVGLAGELEDGIWRDMADFYNPAMRAFSGPYSRCYELDMSIHTCFYDILYLGLGEDRFPFHPFSIESVINPLTVLGDIRIPEDVAARFLQPPRPHQVTRVFRELSERGEPGANRARCTATAWIAPDFMVGALSGSENPSYQLHPFVLFWRAGRALGTIRLLRCLPDGTMNHLHTVLFDGTADAHGAFLRVRNEVSRAVHVFFEIDCADLSAEALLRDCWTLPGLTVRLSGTAPSPQVLPSPEGGLRVTYPLRPGESMELQLQFLF